MIATWLLFLFLCAGVPALVILVRRLLRWAGEETHGQPFQCRVVGHAVEPRHDPSRGFYYVCAQKGCRWTSRPRAAA